MWDAMVSIGISKYLNKANRHNIGFKWVNEIILPRLIFCKKNHKLILLFMMCKNHKLILLFMMCLVAMK